MPCVSVSAAHNHLAVRSHPNFQHARGQFLATAVPPLEPGPTFTWPCWRCLLMIGTRSWFRRVSLLNPSRS